MDHPTKGFSTSTILQSADWGGMQDDDCLPRVAESGPTLLASQLRPQTPPKTPDPAGSQVQLLGIERPPSRSSLRSRSIISSSLFRANHFNSFLINDLTNYSMNDQRWTLQRKKIGLKRKTVGATQKKSRDEKTKDLALKFVKQFKRKECIKFISRQDKEDNDVCYCGLAETQHKKLPPATFPDQRLHTSLDMRRHGVEMFAGIGSDAYTPAEVNPMPLAIQEEEEELDDTALRDRVMPHGEEEEAELDARRQSLLTAEGIVSRRRQSRRSTVAGPGHVADPRLSSGRFSFPDPPPPEQRPPNEGATMGSAGVSNEIPRALPKEFVEEEEEEDEGNSNAPWKMKKSLVEYPTNAYGTIDFVNDNSGSSKPSKYVRMSNSTRMEPVLSLLTDYWRLMEPTRPNLVLSVTGGAKNFKLDGIRKATFTNGLIKAVRSTNAWLLTGGVNIGVMRSVGEAVKQGQHIIKVKRKNVFAEETLHLVRGIKCLGVAPWGYVKHYNNLINPDPSQFSNIKYRADEKSEKRENVSLNGDHTHFILVDNGIRHSFSGADRFRTRLEEAIQMPEPTGLGIPVVLLLLEGGLSSIVKCSMALKSHIPVVVVAGTGRAADLIAFGVSMTHEAPGGRFVMRKAHRKQLNMRVEALMGEYTKYSQKLCSDMVVQCCQMADLITIYDINSGDGMDKYILYALLKGDGLNNESSRLDQLHLSLLWNRPDIAESHIFPALPYWPTGSLEDLTTMALLDEKVEFVRLFVINGLVTAEYLTISNLRHLYNASCDPNSHLTKLLNRTTHSKYFHLHHVHKLLLALLGQHNDENYRKDTPQASIENSAINYYTFEDPNHELFLWAILSGRGNLARYLWERCNSPLTAAVVGSALYRALWRSLGAKNTEVRSRYHKHSDEFEKLGVRLLEECYAEDPVNAMGLVERRSNKWGMLDCLEMALTGNEMNFIASSCSQASIDLSWRRGMVRASTLPSLITIFVPVLIWTRLFSFQKLGDTGGELTKFQKLIVFYKSPMTKFYAHSLAFIAFLFLYAYVVLFDFRYQVANSEKILLFWILTNFIEEISELFNQQSTTAYAKIATWFDSVWNRFDLVSFLFAICALILRSNQHTFGYGRITYAFNTAIFFCRLLRIYHIHYSLGPKLVIFYRMLSEVMVFMGLLVIFILGYGLAAQSLLLPSPSRTFDTASLWDTVRKVILTPYWQMYGELQLDEMQGPNIEICHPTGYNQKQVCENPSNYTWAVYIMLIFYLIIGNIMLLNLLIAIFTYVFDEVHENSMEIWKFERYRLIREFDAKPGLVPPFVLLEHFYRLSKWFWKKYLREKKENLDDYMSDTLLTLRIFEKEAVTSFLAKLKQTQDAALDQKVARITEKIDTIAKFVEQEQELRAIEEDLGWTTNVLEIDEDMIEGRHSSKDSSRGPSPVNGPADDSQAAMDGFTNHLTVQNEIKKDSSSSHEEGEGKQKKNGKVFVKTLNIKKDPTRTIKSVTVARMISAPMDDELRSVQKSIRRLSTVKLESKKNRPFRDQARVLEASKEEGNEGEDEDELEEELSGDGMGKEMDRLRHQLVHTARTLPSSALSMRKPKLPSSSLAPQLGGGWDGELHYPSRPTSATLRRATSSRTPRHRSAADSAARALQEVNTLSERFDDLTETVTQSQKKIENLLMKVLKQNGVDANHEGSDKDGESMK